jgi:hypothetical protein
MNSTQRIILAIGVVALLANGLFPPFQGEMAVPSTDFRKMEMFLGYGFLFNPPTRDEIYKSFEGRLEHIETPSPEGISVNAHVANSKVWLQFATIISSTVGLLILTAGRSKREP